MSDNLESPFLELEWGGDDPDRAAPRPATALEAETPYAGPWRPLPASAVPPPAEDRPTPTSAPVASTGPEAGQLETEPPELAAEVAAEQELWEMSGPPGTVDPAVAVPPIAFFKRLLMPAKVLNRNASTAAVQRNQQWHPAVSGVDPDQIRTQLSGYVSLPVVRGAIEFYNRAHPDEPIALGAPPIDAVFAEAVHQFQAKCYLDPREVDGMAGESTLDSLGFVERTGLRTVDKVNTHALARLARVGPAVRTATRKDYTDWYDDMVNPSFLGRRFNRGVHRTFAHRLRQAELWLLTLPRYRAKTPVELGRALLLDEPVDRGFDQVHKGHRPDKNTTNSMHTFGLAMDIRYRVNPWVSGRAFTTALRHSARLLNGPSPGTGTAAAYLHALGSDASLTTTQIHERLTGMDKNFRDYLRLRGKPGDLARVLAQQWAAQNLNAFDPAERRAGETAGVAAATTRWRDLIAEDYRAVTSIFKGGDPTVGFLNLPVDLVVALRDHACMCWGAVDFGPKASGDMMHFDTRVGGLGDILVRTVADGEKPPARVVSGHPCLATVARIPAPAKETEDGDEDEAPEELWEAPGKEEC